MLEEFKPAPGPWNMNAQYGHITDCNYGRVVVSGVSLPSNATAESNSNARLLLEAGNVYHETGMTPKQLLDKLTSKAHNIMNNTIKLIQYGSKEYLKVTPVKALHNSHMVKDVLNRGDSFAVDLETGELTIIKTAGVKAHYTTQYELHKIKPPVDVEAVREQLRVMAEQIRALSASIGE